MARNSMVSGVKGGSSMNLKDLEKQKNEIEDRIEIAKGEESLKAHKGYSSAQIRDSLQQCLKR